MMVKKEETAEQKLLKMIEASAPAPAASTEEIKVEKKFSMLAIVKIANKILLLCVIASVVFLAFELKVGIESYGKVIKVNIEKSSTRKDAAKSFVPNMPKLAAYLTRIKRRNLFTPYEKPVAKTSVKVSEDNRRIVQATQNYRLVGVSWLDSVKSASVMLEDTEKKVTYFLQAGEKVGDIIVKTIYADSVELGYESEEIIIRYDKSQM